MADDAVKGGLAEVEGIAVATLSGTPEDIGSQHVKLLAGRFSETETAFMRLMPRIPGGPIGKWLVRQFVMYQLNRIEDFLLEDELAEMKAIAAADSEHRGTYRDILYYHVLQDIGQNYACTGAAAAGSASRLQGPVVGRNFDMDNRGRLEPIKTIFLCRPSEGFSYVSIAWPGMVGAVSGMNERGLSVMVFSAKSEGTRLSGVPVAFIAKRVLNQASDIGDAVDIINNSARMGPNIFLLADREKAAAVEFDADNVGVRVLVDGKMPLANHYLSEPLCGGEKNCRQKKYSDSRQRYERISQLMDAKEAVGVEEMLSMLRDHRGPDGRMLAWDDVSAVNNVKDAHSVIFDPAGMRFWVSKAPYAYGRFAGFRFTGTALEQIETLPEEAYPESDAGKRAASSDALMQMAFDVENSSAGDAMKFAEDALAADPANYMAALFIADSLLKENLFREAFGYYDKAARAAPGGTQSFAEALAGRGESLMGMGMLGQARADLEAVLALDVSEEANLAATMCLEKMGVPEDDIMQAVK